VVITFRTSAKNSARKLADYTTYMMETVYYIKMNIGRLEQN